VKITPSQFADRMKAEIVAAVRAGDIPASVPSFSALHDYCDANMLGGAEAILIAISDELKSEAAGMTAHVDLSNAAMDIVDAWIRTGALERMPRRPMPMAVGMRIYHDIQSELGTIRGLGDDADDLLRIQFDGDAENTLLPPDEHVLPVPA
jgi:hypothetical protein